MRATAQVGKCALRIGGDSSVFKFADEFDLILFAAFAKHVEGIGFGNFFPYDGVFVTGQLEHLGLDGGEIGSGNGSFARVYIVVETIFNSRTDTEFDTGIELLQGLGQQVSRRVPKGMLAFGIVPFEEFDGRIGSNGTGKVPLLTIDSCGKNFLCQPGADALGNL